MHSCAAFRWMLTALCAMCRLIIWLHWLHCSRTERWEMRRHLWRTLTLDAGDRMPHCGETDAIMPFYCLYLYGYDQLMLINYSKAYQTTLLHLFLIWFTVSLPRLWVVNDFSFNIQHNLGRFWIWDIWKASLQTAIKLYITGCFLWQLKTYYTLTMCRKTSLPAMSCLWLLLVIAFFLSWAYRDICCSPISTTPMSFSCTCAFTNAANKETETFN